LPLLKQFQYFLQLKGSAYLQCKVKEKVKASMIYRPIDI